MTDWGEFGELSDYEWLAVLVFIFFGAIAVLSIFLSPLIGMFYFGESPFYILVAMPYATFFCYLAYKIVYWFFYAPYDEKTLRFRIES